MPHRSHSGFVGLCSFCFGASRRHEKGVPFANGRVHPGVVASFESGVVRHDNKTTSVVLEHLNFFLFFRATQSGLSTIGQFLSRFAPFYLNFSRPFIVISHGQGYCQGFARKSRWPLSYFHFAFDFHWFLEENVKKRQVFEFFIV